MTMMCACPVVASTICSLTVSALVPRSVRLMLHWVILCVQTSNLSNWFCETLCWWSFSEYRWGKKKRSRQVLCDKLNRYCVMDVLIMLSNRTQGLLIALYWHVLLATKIIVAQNICCRLPTWTRRANQIKSWQILFEAVLWMAWLWGQFRQRGLKPSGPHILILDLDLTQPPIIQFRYKTCESTEGEQRNWCRFHKTYECAEELIKSCTIAPIRHLWVKLW